MASDSSPVFTSRKVILEILQQLLLFGLWIVISHMVWQKRIAHIFTRTNIIIPKHKHVNISVFSPGRDTASDLSYEKNDSLCMCKIHLPTLLLELAPEVSPLFVGSQGGREERERNESGKMAQGRGHRLLALPLGWQPQPQTLITGKAVCLPRECKANNWATQSRDRGGKDGKAVIRSLELGCPSSSLWFSLQTSQGQCLSLKIYSNNLPRSSIS